MKRKNDTSEADFGKHLADEASKSPLLAMFLSTSSLELAALPADVIVNEIILRDLTRFVQLMLINKTLRNEIEKVPRLYYNLFKYHFRDYHLYVHDHLLNHAFYDTFLYFIMNEGGWLGGDNSDENESECHVGITILFGLKPLRMTTNLLELMALILPERAHHKSYADDLDRRMSNVDTETALLLNRIFAAVVPFGVPPVRYYMENHAYFRHEIIMPLLNKMYHHTNPVLSPNSEPFYLFITHMRVVTLRNHGIFHKDRNKHVNTQLGYTKELMIGALDRCTEVNPVYVLNYLKEMINSLGPSMENELREFIENTTFPLLNDLINDPVRKTRYFVDTIKCEDYEALLLNSFKSPIYVFNVDEDYWADELTKIKNKLAQIRAYTFNKESIDAIEKAELSLSYAKKDGIDKWIESEAEKGAKESDLFKRLFYCALKKTGINFASLVRPSTPEFDSYCHACPMGALYEEEGVATPRFFCSVDCQKMTVESLLSV